MKRRNRGKRIARLASPLLALCVALSLQGSVAEGASWPDVALRVERDLASPDPVARRSAAPLLAELGAGRAEPLVLRALEDVDPEVRLAAAHSAVRLRIASATLAVIPWLSAASPEERLAACEVAASLPSPRAVTPVSRALNDGDPAVRAAAADALGASGEPDLALPPLLGKLDDPSPSVRAAVVRALGALDDPRAVVPLIGKLQDSVVDVRKAAARTLGDLADDRAVASLQGALHDGSEDVQVAAMGALGSLAAAPSARPAPVLGAAVSALAPWALDRKMTLRKAALSALGRLGGEASVAALVGALGAFEDAGGPLERTPVRDALVAAATAQASAPGAVRGALLRVLDRPASDALATSAAWVLGALGEHGTAPAIERAMRAGVLPNEAGLHALAGAGTGGQLPLVLELMTDGSARVRKEARGAALALLDPASPDGRAAEPLESALADTRLPESERAELLELLGKTGAKRVAPLLAGYARSGGAPARIAAIDALGVVGAAEGAPLLLQALHDDDPTVRVHAALALGASGGPSEREALLAGLDAPDQIDHATVLTALGGILSRAPSEAAVKRLGDDLQSAAGPERDAVLEAVGRAPLASARALVEGLAVAPDPDDRRAAIAVLGGHPDGLARVRAALGDGEGAVRAAAAWALGAVGTPEDNLRLVARAGDEAQVAANAMAAIGRIGARFPPAAPTGAGLAPVGPVATLCALLGKPLAPYVRANLLASLRAFRARCGEGAVERALLLSSPDEAVREAAARLMVAFSRGADDRAALRGCAQSDRSGHVAGACAERPGAASALTNAKAPHAATHAVTVYVSDGIAPEPVARAPYALATPDGYLRLGVSDRRGAFFDPAMPKGSLSLRSPTPASPVRGAP